LQERQRGLLKGQAAFVAFLPIYCISANLQP